MRLEKWYADVIRDGNVSVHYRAHLAFGPLRIAYRGELGHDMHHRGTFTSTAGTLLPRIEGDADAGRVMLATQAGALAWRNALSRPIRLWTDGRQHVTWNPVVLNGSVEDAVEAVRHGRGYAEKLVMTIAPWRLGMTRLWWGRFCGDRHSFVWIVWEGRHPLRLALLDGAPVWLDAVTECAVFAAAVRLRLGERRLLVDQTLAGTLADMPLPKRVAPLFLSGRERKWFAESDLQRDGRAIDRGEVVCETVDWS
jgi:hypothetical protein